MLRFKLQTSLQKIAIVLEIQVCIDSVFLDLLNAL
jgi:hypothetical protein